MGVVVLERDSASWALAISLSKVMPSHSHIAQQQSCILQVEILAQGSTFWSRNRGNGLASWGQPLMLACCAFSKTPRCPAFDISVKVSTCGSCRTKEVRVVYQL